MSPDLIYFAAAERSIASQPNAAGQNTANVVDFGHRWWVQNDKVIDKNSETMGNLQYPIYTVQV